MRPIARGGAHCNAGWAGTARSGGLGGRAGGTITTKGRPVSASTEEGHDAIAAAVSMQSRMQKTHAMQA